MSCWWNSMGVLIVSGIADTGATGQSPGGGHWPRKGVWGCAALKTPFSHLSCRSQGSHFKQKSQFTRPPFEKIWKFSLNSLNFHPNLSSQAPKFGNFQLTSPQIWKFSAHKPPFSEANVSSQAPHFGRTPLPEKKLSAPPPRGRVPCHWQKKIGKESKELGYKSGKNW